MQLGADNQNQAFYEGNLETLSGGQAGTTSLKSISRFSVAKIKLTLDAPQLRHLRKVHQPMKDPVAADNFG